jgi:hypothetical protein
MFLWWSSLRAGVRANWINLHYDAISTRLFAKYNLPVNDNDSHTV